MATDDPKTAEFWWRNHETSAARAGLDKPFRRNPSDIDTALELTPGAHDCILDALKAATRFNNIGHHQGANEVAINTAIARLLDAGILKEGDNAQAG